MSTTAIQPQAEMTISISDLSVMADIRRLLKHVKGVESISVRKKKSELDICLEEIDEGKVVNVGSVDNLMQYLHS
ncbi:MAG: hypothetical protein MJZ36_05420 [Bacteroidaceae bacterium]|nr:hypothetical protein [Bacteroidaceae bacterium]